MRPTIRSLVPADAPALLDLYRAASGPGSGLARTAGETDLPWAEGVIAQSLARGVTLGAFDADERLIGELHALRLTPRSFEHVLGDLTIGCRPDAQGQGVGAALFEAVFAWSAAASPRIQRIELFCREGNVGGLRLYQRMGFVPEGRLKARLVLADGTVEDDIVLGRTF
jgi:RimJ/RimL family protein N-acetyltransferase